MFLEMIIVLMMLIISVCFTEGGGDDNDAVVSIGDDEINFDNFDKDTEGNSKKPDPSGQSAEQLPEGFLKKYEGKSREEILQAMHKAEQYSGDLNRKLNEKKQQDVRTSDAVKKEQASINSRLKELRGELDELDETLEADKHATKSKELIKLEKEAQKKGDEYVDLLAEEKSDLKFNQAYNDKFFVDKRESLANEYGLELDDSAWAVLQTKTKELNGGGKMTEDSFLAAAVMTLGASSLTALMKSQADLNTRENIRTAGSNATVPKTSQSKTKVSWSELPIEKQAAYIDQMSSAQFNEYLKKKGQQPTR